MQEFVRGTTRQRISRKNLGTLKLSVPSVGDQIAVARFLDRVESKRGSAKNHVVAARKAVKRLHQAVLAAACSGRLTSDWRDARDGTVLSGLLSPAGVTPLSEAPNEWRWAQLQDIAEVRGGVQKGAKLKAGEVTREVPYLCVANVQRGWLDLSEIKTIARAED